MPSCWFAQLPGAGPCDGRLVRCHLIPQQTIKRSCATTLFEYVPGERARTVPEWLRDPRSWVWGCGGPTGIGGHHGRLDSRGCSPLRIPRHRLPPGLEEFAVELGLVWWLDREYGPREAA